MFCMQKDKHMRNSKTLLRTAASVVVGAACFLLGAGVALADEGSSAGPAALTMFPVSEKANPANANMKPVIFNHAIHEGKVEDCTTCHHTGDPVACTTCHTVEGKAEGNYITLERAMHATNIKKRPECEVTPQSCVSCHEARYKENRQCAGCHAIVKPQRNAQWCATCHNADVTPAEMAKGRADKYTLDVRGELAQRTLKKSTPVELLSPLDGPLTVYIDELSDKYEGNRFNHRRHVASLMDRIKDSKLAAAFHNNPETLCATCHHRSPLSKTPPKCGSCHSKEINPAAPERPTLKAAYHLQCMGCHDGMNVARPLKTSCVTCHKVKTAE